MITDIGNTNGRRPLDLHDLQESKSEIANCGWRARPLLHNWRTRPRCNAMIGENWQLVTNELVEFEKTPGVVQDSRKITDHFRGIYRVYPNLVKENRWMPTCNHQLDLPFSSTSCACYGNQALVTLNHFENPICTLNCPKKWILNQVFSLSNTKKLSTRELTLNHCQEPWPWNRDNSKRKCPKAVPTHLQNHVVVWSQTLECSVKSYVARPSTKCRCNEFLFMYVVTHDNIA